MKLIESPPTWLIVLLVWSVAANGQTCMIDTAPATSSHLVDNQDGTISDSKTGLMWKQCPEGQGGADCSLELTYQSFNWQEALQQAETVNNNGGYAGHSDWRLPNIKELETLIERQCNDPSINLTMFPNSIATHGASTTMEFLSSTPFLVHGFRRVWVAGFASGNISSQGSGYWSGYKVRLVRNQNP